MFFLQESDSSSKSLAQTGTQTSPEAIKGQFSIGTGGTKEEIRTTQKLGRKERPSRSVKRPMSPSPQPQQTIAQPTQRENRCARQWYTFLLWTSKYILVWIHKPKYYGFQTNEVILQSVLWESKTATRINLILQFYFLENLWKKLWVHLWQRVCEQRLPHSSGTKALSTMPWLVHPSSNSIPLFPSKELWWLLDILIGCWIILIWIVIKYTWIKLSLVLEITLC